MPPSHSPDAVTEPQALGSVGNASVMVTKPRLPPASQACSSRVTRASRGSVASTLWTATEMGLVASKTIADSCQWLLSAVVRSVKGTSVPPGSGVSSPTALSVYS